MPIATTTPKFRGGRPTLPDDKYQDQKRFTKDAVDKYIFKAFQAGNMPAGTELTLRAFAQAIHYGLMDNYQK